jgi:CARDB
MKLRYLLPCMLIICFANKMFSQIVLNESFDGVTFVPAGWYKAKIFPASFPASGQWERITAGTNPVLSPHSGAAMARFDSPTAGSGTISELGTSALNFSAGGTYRVRFWVYRGDNAWSANDLLDIYINTQQNITGASKLGTVFISRMNSPTEAANGWYEYMFDLPASFNTATNYIIFRATGYSSNVVYLDDVVVEAYTCNKPVNVLVTNVLTTTATVNWDAPAAGTPSGYDWELRTNGSAGAGATGLAASGTTAAGQTTASLSGLTQGITHSFYVRSSCGTVKSTWSNAVAFNTQCNPASIPYTENFDGIATGVPACTFVENTNGGYTWSSSLNWFGSSYSRSAPNAMGCINGGLGAANPQNDWFYTAALNLEAGKCYQLSFAYRTTYGSTTSIKVNLGQAQNAAAMTVATLFNNAAITNDSYAVSTTVFLVPSTGIYFIGFNYNGVLGNGSAIVDDISVTESVGIPTAINANPVGATTAQLNWAVPACGTATGYEWELRTSGAAGSGASGLTTTGNGTGLSNTFTGLTENRVYTFYIRSKAGTAASSWSNGVAFQTVCNIRPLPYTQNFDGVVAPALPTCFTRQDLNIVYNYSYNTWITEYYDRPNSYPNCMRIGTNNSTYAGNNWFFTPPFNFTAGQSYRLHFYYHNFIYNRPEKLEVKFGTAANAASMTSAAIFSDADIRNALYKKAVVDFVPAQNGNHHIGFRFFSEALGNFFYLDDIKVEETPLCDVARDISSKKITATAATINWLDPQAGTPAGYQWELRTSGTPASGAAGLTASGSLPAGALSVPLSNLTGGTAYTFYISSNCGVQNSEWVAHAFTAACSAVYVPYTENFDGVVAPALPSCTRVEEQLDQYKWNNTTGIARSAPNSLYHPYNFSSPLDDWFFTAPLQLTAGRTYRLSFYYRQEVSGYTDAIEVKLGRYAQGDSMTVSTVYSNTNVSSTGYQLATVDFTVPSSGVYHFGIHSVIGYYGRGVAIDDINVNELSPELVITNPGITVSTAATSETITANFTVANPGLNNAAAHKTYFYLSADNVLTPGANGDTLLGFYNNATAINAGSNTGNLSKQLTIPCALVPGNYTLFIVADGEGVITEINETNNRATVPIAITEGEYWNGLVNTSWETPGNWSCNLVPGPNTNVVINSGTVVVHVSTTIRSLAVKPGVNFTVTPGVVLTILQ